MRKIYNILALLARRRTSAAPCQEQSIIIDADVAKQPRSFSPSHDDWDDWDDDDDDDDDDD